MSAPAALTVGGAAPLRGRIRLPGDKGISHRALLFAALADGASRIVGLAAGADVARTRDVLTAVGVEIVGTPAALTVQGRAGDLREPGAVLDCGNSGTTMRTATGLLAGGPGLAVLTGDDSLRERPMGRVVTPLRAMGAHVDGRADGTLAPLVVRGGDLQGVVHTLPESSAQVKTALVLAGLRAHGITVISTPAPTRDHTERMLAALGVPIAIAGTTVSVERGTPTAFELEVPGDPSSAAFWCVAAAVTPGSDVVVEGVSVNPTRLGFVDVLRRMGATIEVVSTSEHLGEPAGDIRVVAGPLHATTIGGDEIPDVQDEIPVLAVAAAFADGVTQVSDAAELRVKESDRIDTVAAMLAALGVGVETSADGLTIRGGRPRAGRLDSLGDHRIALAGAIAGHALDGTTEIVGFDAAAVSYPEFVSHLASLTGDAT